MNITNGAFVCSWCGKVTIPLNVNLAEVFEGGVVEMDEGGHVAVVLYLNNNRELRHDCPQVPAAVVAELCGSGR